MGLYHATSGSPVAVQHHQIKGPVGYTVQGSPTIVDGVASGFSSSDYLGMTSVPPSVKPTQYSASTKIITGTGTFSNATILGNRNAYNYGFKIIDGKIQSSMYSGSSYLTAIGPTLNENTTYYLKMDWKASTHTITLSVSNDNSNWTEYTNVSMSFEPDLSYFLEGRIGFSSAIGGSFNGSIDLNHTYIKVNDTLWFYQPQETKYIKRGTSLVYAKPSMYLTGPVNYTVVGSPTIVDNVVSGFSVDNKIYTSDNFFPESRTWEIVTKFNVTDLTNNAVVFQRSDGYLQVSVRNNGKLRYYAVGTDGSGISGFYASDGSHTLSVGNTYYLKVAFNGATYTGSISTDGISWDLDKTASSTVPLSTSYHRPIYFGFNSVNNNEVFPGSIDLNNTYIKVNGSLWFYGKNYASQNIAPVPAGFSYNNITTPSIGYVDMRTQAFSPAPIGAHFALPSGFTEVAGLTMNDDCYWEIPNFKLHGNDTVRVSFQPTSACNLLGCYTTASAQDNYSVYLSTTANSKYLRYNGGAYYSTITSNTRYNIVITPTGCTGFDQESTWSESSFTTSTDFIIGTTSLSATSAKFKGTIFGSIIVDNRAQFIPVKRTSDSALGYYEVYSNTFYLPNAGTPTEYTAS